MSAGRASKPSRLPAAIGQGCHVAVFYRRPDELWALAREMLVHGATGNQFLVVKQPGTSDQLILEGLDSSSVIIQTVPDASTYCAPRITPVLTEHVDTAAQEARSWGRRLVVIVDHGAPPRGASQGCSYEQLPPLEGKDICLICGFPAEAIDGEDRVDLTACHSHVLLHGRHGWRLIHNDPSASSRRSQGALQAFYDHLLAARALWVSVFEAGAVPTLWNKAAETISGYSADEAVGSSGVLRALFPDKEYRRTILTKTQRLLEQDEGLEDFETDIRCKDGTVKTVLWWATTLPATDTVSPSILVMAMDVTDRRRAEEEHKKLFERVPVGLYRTTPEGVIIDANPALVDLLGYESREALLISNVFDGYVVANDRETWMALVAETTEEIPYETTWRRADGSHVRVRDFARAIRDAEGAVIYYEGSVEDITAWTSAEEQRRLSEARYRALFHDAPIGIAMLDMDGVVVDCNAAAADMGHLDREKLIGTHFSEIGLFEHHIEGLVARYQRIIEGHQVPPFELKVSPTEDESIWIELAANIVEAAEATYNIQILIRDITAQKHAEQEASRIQTELIQAQKMEAIGSLVGGVAHDFNNVLTAIQGYTEMAMMKQDMGQSASHYLKEVHRASMRATEIIQRLLLFSRNQSLEVKAIDLNSTIETMMLMVKRLIGEDIGVATELADELPPIQGNAGSIEQVLINLIVNARDAMPNGGTIHIGTSVATLDEAYCSRFPGSRPGTYVCVAVSDTGVGMDDATMRRIFEPFFTTKPPGAGTGLGLAIAYGIITQHEGWMNAYSEEGQGSTFRVYLPALLADMDMDSVRSGPDVSIKGKGEGILVVEDEDPVRRFAVEVLAANGYEVFAAPDATTAWQLFTQHRHAIKLIFSDVVLPDMSGIELVARVRTEAPDIPLVLTSGYADHKSRWDVIQEKGYPFLHKPYSLGELLTSIKDALTPEE